jgi:hypothetical protein
MATRKTPSRSTASRPGGTPPSVSDENEQLAGADAGPLFADDGRKVRDTERVGAMAPDADPEIGPFSLQRSRRRPWARPLR